MRNERETAPQKAQMLTWVLLWLCLRFSLIDLSQQKEADFPLWVTDRASLTIPADHTGRKHAELSSTDKLTAIELNAMNELCNIRFPWTNDIESIA